MLAQRSITIVGLSITAALVALLLIGRSGAQDGTSRPTIPAPDAVAQAQTTSPVPVQRPEQRLTDHDRSTAFRPENAPASSPAFQNQPEQGQPRGFDFARDPLNAKKPMQTFAELMQADVAEKPGVMEQQQKLLATRYDLTPRLDPEMTMSRGKPLAVGPTARLADGLDWERLAGMTPEEIKKRKLFPYPSLPHPKQVTGGQVFPRMQIAMFPRLERFDVDHDLPEAFLPEFPPAIFLQNRPDLGDVSRGEVVSINNFHRLFKDLLTPVQLDGLRMLLTPLPQEEFNPTDDRKTAQASLGVACLDCHVNGHTTAQFHLNPDDRPQHRRFRLDTMSLRGDVQPADPRVQAEPPLGGGFHRVRAADGLLQRRSDPGHEEGHHHPRSRPRKPHGADAEHVRLPAGAEAQPRGPARSRQAIAEPRSAARSSSSARRSAAPAIRRLPTSITRCTT